MPRGLIFCYTVYRKSVYTFLSSLSVQIFLRPLDSEIPRSCSVALSKRFSLVKSANECFSVENLSNLLFKNKSRGAEEKCITVMHQSRFPSFSAYLIMGFGVLQRLKLSHALLTM